jgi:hypothetical protein
MFGNTIETARKPSKTDRIMYGTMPKTRRKLFEK